MNFALSSEHVRWFFPNSPQTIADVDLAELARIWNPTRLIGVIFIAFVVIVALAFLFMFARYFKLWLQAFVSRARIGPFALIGMSLRKVNPRIVAETKIMAVQAGLSDITTNAIEAHYLAGGISAAWCRP